MGNWGRILGGEEGGFSRILREGGFLEKGVRRIYGGGKEGEGREGEGKEEVEG